MKKMKSYPLKFPRRQHKKKKKTWNFPNEIRFLYIRHDLAELGWVEFTFYTRHIYFFLYFLYKVFSAAKQTQVRVFLWQTTRPTKHSYQIWLWLPPIPENSQVSRKSSPTDNLTERKLERERERERESAKWEKRPRQLIGWDMVVKVFCVCGKHDWK